MDNHTAQRVYIRLFGAPEVQVAGLPLALGNHKARALLFYLAGTDQPHTRDHLATLLWSESPASEARHSLRSCLYHLRQALRAGDIDEVLIGDGELVQLRITEDECDVARFRRLLAEGSQNALNEAVTLYRGPLLQGFSLADAPLFEEWTRFVEDDLNRACAAALERLSTWAESRQAWSEAIAYVQRMAQIDPLVEETQQRLMRLYLRNGNAGLALRQYQQFETRLRHELGVAPAIATQLLFQEALQHQHGVTLPAPSLPRPSVHTTQTLPYIERDNLLARLQAISKDPIAGHGVTVLLQGESGIGKTRMLEELAARLSTSSPPWMLLRGSCSPFDDLLAYGPFLEVFQGTAAGDLTDLLTVPHATIPDARGRFFYAVLQALRTLACNGPLLLAIDDLQWANSLTLNLFGFLSMRLHTLPVMLVGTVDRSEAIPALQRLITLGRRRGELHLLSVTPLSPEAVTTLLHAIAIRSSAVSTLAEWLYDRSGGSPFVLAEILAQLRADAILVSAGGDWEMDATRWLHWRATFSLPETTHDLVAWRLANLTPDAQRLLELLAVAGQPLPFVLLGVLPDLQPNQLASTVDDLLSRQLISEIAPEMFALPHHLLRETILHRLSHIRRRTLHRQIAEALETCSTLQSDPPLRQIALHAVAGEDLDRARRYGLQVLADLPQHSIGAQTLDFVHHLYDLLAPSASTEELLRLTHALTRLHRSLGQIDAASHWNREHLKIARTAGDILAQITAHFEMSELALVTGDYAAAAASAEAGLVVCTTSPDPLFTVLAGRGKRLLGAAMAMDGNDLRAAESHLQEAVTVQRNSGNLSDLCSTLFELGNVAAQRGDISHALAFYEEAAGVAESANVQYYLALARNNFAYHSLLLGRPEAAKTAVEQGLKLAESQEMLGVLVYLYSTQGEIHLYRAEWTAAAEAFRRGAALADELGHHERQAGYRASLALVAWGKGELEEAVTHLEEALTLIAGQGYWHLRTRILIWLAGTLFACGRIAEAWPHLEAALPLARMHGRSLLLVQCERLRARLLANSGDWHSANVLFAETLKQAESLHLPLEFARTQAAWGEAMLRYSASPDEGYALLAEARVTFEAHGARADLQAIAIPLAN